MRDSWMAIVMAMVVVVVSAALLAARWRRPAGRSVAPILSPSGYYSKAG
jgi:hypothetical protein